MTGDKVALCSVWDKVGLDKFCRQLSERGWKLMASGGTASHIRECGVDVIEVSDYTRTPEVIGGRVKTLHPAIHAGILARDSSADRNELKSKGWHEIDMVIVNLYPFRDVIADPLSTIEIAIENIDIGGVALLRAAGKNYHRCTVVSDPEDYDVIIDCLDSNGIDMDVRKKLALKAFGCTSQYDSAIASYLGDGEIFDLRGYHSAQLGYGENPHQDGTLYSWHRGGNVLGGRVHDGKEVSYNNVLDMNNTIGVLRSYKDVTAVIMKHNAPCGIATRGNVYEAIRDAIACDPVSAFGSVVGVNRVIDIDGANSIKDLFVECVVAPGFEKGALDILRKKKKCRLLEVADLYGRQEIHEVRSVTGGLLVQSVDAEDMKEDEIDTVSSRMPTETELENLIFAWTACKHVKSNAIVLANRMATAGIGGGQPSRVQSVEIAIRTAGQTASGSVMASDAFFPFPDGIELAAKYGITAVIQPGGSIRDNQVVDAVNSHNMAMVFTGKRHFKH